MRKKKSKQRNDDKQEKTMPSGVDGLRIYMSQHFTFQIIYQLMH